MSKADTDNTRLLTKQTPRVVDYGNASVFTVDTLIGLDAGCGVTQLVFGLEQRETFGSQEITCNVQLRLVVPTARLPDFVAMLTGNGVMRPEMFAAAHETVN